ncbi:MAG: hypothetical protein H6706_07685 [Myxococcales bacterium]|nr:hypothetical protein [Myxococcales bacterium]
MNASAPRAGVRVFRLGDPRPIDLGPRQFVAEGGEGKVFTRRGVAFKIHHDRARVPPLDKLHRLAAFDDARILRPVDLLVDAQGRPAGFTSRFEADAWPLGRLFPPAFRQREGVTDAMLRHLIARLRDGVALVHARGGLIVDLNELNFLVLKDFSDVRFIDVDAWQLPGYPATALMDSVRDWTRADFSPETDWFSFAIVTFQLFTGLHPFKGRYEGPDAALRGRLPTDAADDPFAVTRRRMQAGVSVFHPDVRVPAAAAPVDTLPPAWRAWYADLFAAGHRRPPPSSFDAAVVVAPAPVALPPGGLEVTRLDRLEGRLLRLFTDALYRVAVTEAGVFLDGRRLQVEPAAVQVVAFSPRARRPVAVDARGPIPVLTDLTTGATLPFGLAADAVAGQDGQVWLKAGDQVHRLALTEAGDRLFASAQPVAQVLPHAARLFPGVVIQSLLGATYVSLLADDQARQIRVPDLDGFTVLDARHSRGVLIVAGHRGGRYARMVFRFAADDTWDRRDEDGAVGVPPCLVLPSGVCLVLGDDGRLVLRPARPGASGERCVDDPRLAGMPLLAEQGGAVLLGLGAEVLRARVR